MSVSRHVGVWLCALSLLLAALVGGAAAPAGAQSGPTPIDSCRTIADDGRYVLTNDIENASGPVCIQILSSDVVFDGNGHTIASENDSESVGIKVNNSLTTLSNVTVENVSTTGWTAGVYYLGTEGGSIENVNASENGRHGVLLQESSETRLGNVTAADNGRWSLYSTGNATNTTATNFETGTATVSFTATDVALTGIDSPPADPPNRSTVGSHIGVSSAGPNASLRLAANYTDANVTGANVTESTLRMWAYDGEWRQTGGVNFVNIRRNVVETNLQGLQNASVLAPAGVTETPTPTATSTAAGTDGATAPDEGGTNATTSSDDGPGFGPLLALVALLASALLAFRRG